MSQTPDDPPMSPVESAAATATYAMNATRPDDPSTLDTAEHAIHALIGMSNQMLRTVAERRKGLAAVNKIATMLGLTGTEEKKAERPAH